MTSFKHEIVFKVIVRQDKLLVKFVKLLREEEGSIVLVDEVNRRVIFRFPLVSYEKVLPLIEGYTLSSSYELRATLTHNLSSTQLMSKLDKFREEFNQLQIIKPEKSYTRLIGLVKIDSNGGLV